MNFDRVTIRQLKIWIDAGLEQPYDLALKLAGYERREPRPPKESDFTSFEFQLMVKERELQQKEECRDATNEAIAVGILVAEPCEKCGCKKVDCHHIDYGNALDVRWLCRKHHAEEHARLKKIREQEWKNRPVEPEMCEQSKVMEFIRAFYGDPTEPDYAI